MDEKIQSVLNALHQAIDFYALHNIKIQRVLTDRGSSYRSKDFATACRNLRIKHSFTKPYRPQTNGKAEHFIQTITREWAYARSYRSSNHRATYLLTSFSIITIIALTPLLTRSLQSQD